LHCVNGVTRFTDSPALTNDAGTACLSPGPLSAGPSSFAGVAASGLYWSSTAVETAPSRAWIGDLFNGDINNNNIPKNSTTRAWPVRGGPR
jgi:hypothetical protein